VRGVRVGRERGLGEGSVSERIVDVSMGSVFVLLEKRVCMEYDSFVFMVGGEVLECMFMMDEFLDVFEELV
jgi:hypothetical protein